MKIYIQTPVKQNKNILKCHNFSKLNKKALGINLRGLSLLIKMSSQKCQFQ